MDVFTLAASITLDTKDYESGLNKVNKGNENLKSSFSKAGQSSDTLNNKIGVLNAKYEKAQAEVARLTDEFNKSASKTGVTSEETQELAEKLSIAEKNANGLKDELSAMTSEMGTSESKSSNFAATLQSVGDKLKSIGDKLFDTGSKLTKAITVPVSGFAGAAGKMSMDFEDAMAKVSTIADTTVVPIDSLQSAILDLSNETGVAAGEIAESVYNVISATGDTANAVNLVEDATKLATAGFTDSNSALSVLTTAMNAYGLSAEDTAHISDSLIQTQNLGVTTVAELSSNMGKAIATASAYGVNLENLESAYVSLTKGGISTAESTTYVSSMLNELGDSGSTVGKIIQEKTGKSFGTLMKEGNSLADVLGILYESTGRDSEALNNLWGSAEAGKASNAIVNQGLQEFNNNLQQLTESAGTTEGAYEKMQTSSFDLKKAFNEMKNAITELGNVLVPVIIPAFESIIGKVTEVVQWFTSLDDGTQETILAFVGIAAAIGPVLSAIGKISSGIGALSSVISFLVSNPIVAIIAAIAAVVAGIVTLWNTNEDFRNAVMAIWEAIKGFFIDAWEAIQNAWSAAGEFFSSIGQSISDVFSEVTEFLGNAFSSAWEAISSAWSVVVDFFSGVWDGIEKVFSVVADVLGRFFSAAWNAIKAVWDVVVGYYTAVWNGIKAVFSVVAKVLGDFFKSAWNAIKTVWDAVVGFFTGVWNGIKAVFSVVSSTLGGFFSSAWNAIQGVWNAAVGFFSGIWSGITGVFSSVSAWFGNIFNNAWNAIKSAFSNVSSFFSGILNTITGVFSGVWDTFSNIGRNIVQGLWNGIQSLADWLWNMATGWAQSIWNGVKSVFGVASPSKKMYWLGEMVVQGLGNALDNEGWRAVKAMSGMSEDVLAAADMSSIPVGYVSKSEAAAYNGGSLLGGTSGSGVVVNQTIYAAEQSPIELAANTRAAFQRARWAVA